MATSDDVKLWIDKTMKNEGVENYELNISGCGTKGDGYMGEITFVNVEAKVSDLKKCYDFVIKSAKKSDKLRETTPIKDAYIREISIYTQIFPVFEQFQLEYSIEEPFNKYPKCYDVCKEPRKEALVLENLKVQGFDLHDRKVSMNLEHIQYVFVQYARFHSVSMAMKCLKPELFKVITKNIMDDLFGSFIVKSNLLLSFTEYFRRGLKLLDGNARKKYEGFESDLVKVLTKTVYNIEDPWTVIFHGDCWNNNFMFKYDQKEKIKPSDVKFLDFQISRIGHPIIDLSYFLYTCCDKEILENFDSLLELYHSALSDSLSQYGVNVDQFFSLSKLREDWKTFGKFGLYMCTFITHFAFCESEDAPDFVELAENDQDYGSSFVALIKDDKCYNERVKPILEHFSKTFL